MTKEQQQTEAQVKECIDMLNEQRHKIKNLRAANTSFASIQQKYVQRIDDCLAKAQKRMEEVRKIAVWDKLVIAFFGETNAGKSTIIETFRILFHEATRQAALKANPDGADGEIVGTGQTDYTTVSTAYEMQIGNEPFVLIDVPGIEGNEGKYADIIRDALSQAHIVFYVQGQNKKPDQGTADKIKKYLKDWVRVYSIYNVRSQPADYRRKSASERILMDSENQKIEREIEDAFRATLGENYVGNFAVQALAALAAKAKFAKDRNDLSRGQEKFRAIFGSNEALYAFSNFESIIRLVQKKAEGHNYLQEIMQANRLQHEALLKKMWYSIQRVLKEEAENVGKLTYSIEEFKKGVTQDFRWAIHKVEIQSNMAYNSIFDELEKLGIQAIDEKWEKESYESKTKDILDFQLKILQEKTPIILGELDSNIQCRKRILNQELASVSSIKNDVNVKIESFDFDKALKELTFFKTDGMRLLDAASSAVIAGIVFAATNFWNPLGWLTFAGALWKFCKPIILDEDPYAKAKQKMRESLTETKQKARADFDKSIRGITERIEQSLTDINKL